MNAIITLVLTAIVFIAMDLTWLGIIAKSFYWSRLGSLLTDDIVWSAIAIFYVVYILGIFYFAINPAIDAASWKIALINGLLLGILCYATYDLVNMGTLKNWSWEIVIVDIIWGGVITAVSSTVGFLIAMRLA